MSAEFKIRVDYIWSQGHGSNLHCALSLGAAKFSRGLLAELVHGLEMLFLFFFAEYDGMVVSVGELVVNSFQVIIIVEVSVV